jgi:hypothetical protein
MKQFRTTLDKVLLWLATPFLLALGFRRYRRITLILVKPRLEAFSVNAGRGILQGKAGDCEAMNLAKDNRWVIGNSEFHASYETVRPDASTPGWYVARKKQLIWARTIRHECAIRTRENPAYPAHIGDKLAINTGLTDIYPINQYFFSENYARA